jgi:hypothetical protein
LYDGVLVSHYRAGGVFAEFFRIHHSHQGVDARTMNGLFYGVDQLAISG